MFGRRRFNPSDLAIMAMQAGGNILAADPQHGFGHALGRGIQGAGNALMTVQALQRQSILDNLRQKQFEAQQAEENRKRQQEAQREQFRAQLFAGLSPEERAIAQAFPEKYGAQKTQALFKTPDLPTGFRIGESGEPEAIPAWLKTQMMLRQAGAPKTTLNVGPTGIDYGKPEAGLAWARNPDGTVKLDEHGVPVAVPYQGGSVYREAKEEARKNLERKQLRDRYADVVIEEVDRVLEIMDGNEIWTAGMLGVPLSKLYGTPAHNARKLIDTIRSNVGFDRLQQMRESSPMGGALGPVSDFENRLLQSALGSLEQSQDPEQLKYNLMRVRDIYLDIIHGPGNRPEMMEAPDMEIESGTGFPASPGASDMDIESLIDRYAD